MSRIYLLADASGVNVNEFTYWLTEVYVDNATYL